MKTFMAKAGEVERKWYLVDASEASLGRVASQVADILTGKNKTIYTPHVDTGDFVVVINSDKLILTGNKLEDKKMRHYTGYIGGLKEVDYATAVRENSDKVVEKAIKGMLPKNSLGRKQFTRLHVYKGAEHRHEAQKPEKVTIKGVK